jgi:DNA-binding beta-propeller fold protein YncE
MTAVFAEKVSSAQATRPPLERVGTIALRGPAGGLDHLAVDARRGRLFVANTVNNSLDVVDLKAGKLIKQVPDQRRIRGIDYSPEVDRVFVGNGTGGVCNRGCMSTPRRARSS